ncbi:MAG TPA: hypothetical protein VIU62_17780, partial [Chloroflexota bacterium]
ATVGDAAGSGGIVAVGTDASGAVVAIGVGATVGVAALAVDAALLRLTVAAVAVLAAVGVATVPTVPDADGWLRLHPASTPIIATNPTSLERLRLHQDMGTFSTLASVRASSPVYGVPCIADQ